MSSVYISYIADGTTAQIDFSSETRKKDEIYISSTISLAQNEPPHSKLVEGVTLMFFFMVKSDHLIPPGRHAGNGWTGTVTKYDRFDYQAGKTHTSVTGQVVSIEANSWQAWLTARNYFFDRSGMANITATLEIAKRDVAEVTRLQAEVAQLRNLVQALGQQVQNLSTQTA